MEIVKAIGVIFLWALVLAFLYIIAVEATASRQPQKVKRNRFLAMLLLWLIVPVLAGALLGSLLTDAVVPVWGLFLGVGLAIAAPWFIAIRLQIGWARAERTLSSGHGDVSSQRPSRS